MKNATWCWITWGRYTTISYIKRGNHSKKLCGGAEGADCLIIQHQLPKERQKCSCAFLANTFKGSIINIRYRYKTYSMSNILFLVYRPKQLFLNINLYTFCTRKYTIVPNNYALSLLFYSVQCEMILLIKGKASAQWFNQTICPCVYS